MNELTIATRGSKLALAQSTLVADAIMQTFPDVTVELTTVETTGDRDRTTAMTALTELGAFVRSVQNAVLEGRADLAVHSAKDLPIVGPDALIGFHPRRADTADALVGASLDTLSEGAIVGTGSPRREAQLRELRPDLQIVPVRGNVDTRVSLATGGSIDAVVLAVAGLDRIGLSEHISYRFTPREMVPAPAQGALTLEARSGTFAAEVAASLEDDSTKAAVDAERELLAITGAGCRSALGALARVEGQRLVMEAFVSDERGPRRTTVDGADPTEVAEAAQRELGL
ncbi:MAG: hydroxymethylbilane synthase [Acidimicrobiia bacterium]